MLAFETLIIGLRIFIGEKPIVAQEIYQAGENMVYLIQQSRDEWRKNLLDNLPSIDEYVERTSLSQNN